MILTDYKDVCPSCSKKSCPFDRLETGKTAVKVINHYGDEVLKVFGVA